MRIVIAEDMALMRAGLARLLADRGFEVVGEAEDAVTLLRLVERTRPDAALVDIKMPPTHTDEGLRAAAEIRERHPGTAVLLLSSYLDSRYAATLFASYPAGTGLPAQGTRRRRRRAQRRAARHRATANACSTPRSSTGCSTAPASRGRSTSSPPREREILALMAEGHSNRRICELCFLSPKTVESHVHNIFLKLGLGESPDSSRRVLAVLTYLRG